MGYIQTQAHVEHLSEALKAFWAQKRRERILAKVDQSGGPTACWPWTGNRDSKGYGSVKVGRLTKKAHRVVYEFLTGRDLPDALLIRHRCSTFSTPDAPVLDNPTCCNPAHLLEGTLTQNGRDEWGKRRKRSTSTGPVRRKGTVLTPEIIQEIRAWHARGARLVDLAYDYELAVPTIFQITRRQSWKHVPDPGPAAFQKGVPIPKAHMSADTRLTLLAYYASGKTQKEVAARFGVTQTSVSGIVRAAGVARQSRKLSDADILAIRVRYASGESPSKLGAEYGVTARTISQVASRETWAALTAVAYQGDCDGLGLA